MISTHGPVPGSNSNEIVESMIKPEAIVELASAILAVFLYASRTKRPDTPMEPAIDSQLYCWLLQK